MHGLGGVYAGNCEVVKKSDPGISKARAAERPRQSNKITYRPVEWTAEAYAKNLIVAQKSSLYSACFISEGAG